MGPMIDDEVTPVFLINGFLEAGKTSLIRDLLTDDMFDDKAKTLILACEEGEEEYESAMLEKTKAACEYIEDEESFARTGSLLNTMECGRQSISRKCMTS